MNWKIYGQQISDKILLIFTVVKIQSVSYVCNCCWFNWILTASKWTTIKLKHFEWANGHEMRWMKRKKIEKNNNKNNYKNNKNTVAKKSKPSVHGRGFWIQFNSTIKIAVVSAWCFGVLHLLAQIMWINVWFGRFLFGLLIINDLK